jgi:F0F1-type ATP synthase delta subunit
MDLLEKIAQQTYTVSSLKRRCRILKEYFEKKTFGGDLEIQVLDADKDWLASLMNEPTENFTSKNFYAEMDQLNKRLESLPPLTIYLAFEMPDNEIAALAQNIRASLNSNLIFLDLRKDPNLIGGLAMVYKGIYKDYSVRKKIDEQREQILTEIKRYVS